MRFLVLTFALFLVLAGPIAVFSQPDTALTVIAVEPTPTSGPTLLAQIASMLEKLTPVVTVMVALGLGTKYLPFMSKLPNLLIPVLNALVAFLMVFSGGPPPAQAGIFGDFVHSLGFGAKAMGSVALSIFAGSVYETFFRPTLEKYGVFKAGLTEAQKAAKAKVVGAQ